MSNEPIVCSCFEVRKSKATGGRSQRRHGRMTLRGSIGVAGRVRYKCTNRHCGKTVYKQGRTSVPEATQIRLPETPTAVFGDPDLG